MDGSRQVKKIKIYKCPLLLNSTHNDRSILFHRNNIVGIQYTFVVQDPDFSMAEFFENQLLQNMYVANAKKLLAGQKKQNTKRLTAEVERDLNRPKNHQLNILNPSHHQKG